MAKGKFSRADGWHRTGPGNPPTLQYWEKGKVKKPGTEAFKLLKGISKEAQQLLIQPAKMAAVDVKNALSDVGNIGRYSAITHKGKQLTIFEARRKGLLNDKEFSRRLGLIYHLQNLKKSKGSLWNLQYPGSKSSAEVKTEVLEEKEGKSLTPADQIKIASAEAEEGGVSNATPEMIAWQNRLGIKPGDKKIYLSNNNQYLGDTAVGNNQASLKIAKKEKEKEETQPFLRSDVFTLDADGNRLGVMSNRRRLAWDKENQALMRSRQKGIDPITGKSKLKIADRTYSGGFVGAG